MSSGELHITYLVSHPIQYQAPLLRLVAASPNVKLRVIFLSDLSLHAYADPGFGQTVTWDVPLIGGYHHEFADSIGDKNRLSRTRPITVGLGAQLSSSRVDVMWVHGYGHYALLQAVLWAKRRGIPVLLRGESHLRLRRTRRQSQLLRFVAKNLFSLYDGFLSIGQWNREFYLNLGVDSSRVFSMPYAVDNAWFMERSASEQDAATALRKDLGFSEDRPLILFASKLQKRKRVLDLLEAYSRLSIDGRTEPFPGLIIAGDGDDRAEVEKRVQSLGWQSIKVLGFQSQRQLARLYSMCDGLVLPSEDEPWGLVVNEAMACGKPVIVSDGVGCSPDLVKPGQNGEIFPTGDIQALSDALSRVFATRERAREMGQVSHQQIKKFSLEESVSGLLQAARVTTFRPN